MTGLAVEGRIAACYDHAGPFVTAYLDATLSTENGRHEVEVRWRELRRELTEAGADDTCLAAMEDRLAADAGTPGPHGLVLVAAEGRLVLSDELHRPPARSIGRVGPLPHLLPYLAQRTTDVPHVVVVADRTGADLLAVSGADDPTREAVAGDTQHPVHRTGRDTWSERHFQNRVENAWESNAKDVAGAVVPLVRQHHARLVVVAGDVRARNLVVDDLAAVLGSAVTVCAVDEGGRGNGSSTAALEDAVHDQVLRQAWRERREVLEHLQQNLGRQEYAVQGAAEVAAALRMAQVDTVVLSDDPSSTLRAWVGREATQFGLDDAEALGFGIESVQHDRYDAALVRAVVGTGAQLVVTPGAHDYLRDGIGALLRFDTLSS